jgi:hypothetical protein
LKIWDDTGTSGKPNNVIYQNTNFSTVEYTDELNGFKEYFFEQKILLPAGEYYVGMQQLDARPLNIGMDFNTNRKSKIYFNVSGNWVNSSYKGALMIRPIFATLCDELFASVDEIEEMKISVYPNPANDKLYIESDETDFKMTLIDLTGRIISIETTNSYIDVSFISEGIYILQFESLKTGKISVEKIMIKR